jgi:hypothetical protein
MRQENSCVLICVAARLAAVNEAVAAALDDPIGAANLYVPLSIDGNTITHYGGHAWLTDEQAKALAGIPGLMMRAVVLDGQPFDHWLVALKEADMLAVKRDRKGVTKIEPRKEPENPGRISIAREKFEQKSREAAAKETEKEVR